VSTWASADAFLHTNSSVLFFYSATEVAKCTTSQDLKMRSSLTQAMDILAGHHERVAAAAGKDGVYKNGRKRVRVRRVRKIIHHGASIPGLKKSNDGLDNGGSSSSSSSSSDSSQRSLLSLGGMVSDVFHTHHHHRHNSSSSSSSADVSQNVFMRAARGIDEGGRGDVGNQGHEEETGRVGGRGEGGAQSIGATLDEEESSAPIRHFHRRSMDPDYVITSPYKCAVSENLAPPAVAGAPFPSQVPFATGILHQQNEPPSNVHPLFARMLS